LLFLTEGVGNAEKGGSKKNAEGGTGFFLRQKKVNIAELGKGVWTDGRAGPEKKRNFLEGGNLAW